MAAPDLTTLAPIDAIPLPGDIFDWYTLRVRRGDRFYSQVLQSGFGALTLPQIVERVAVAGEMVRDDERDETNRAGTGRADSIAENAFQDQRDDDRAPADEDR